MLTPILVGLGGAIGAITRYYVSLIIATKQTSSFPLGTLFVNVLGSFLIGVFLIWFEKQDLAADSLRLFFAIGFLGALTTFSTFSWETLRLIQTQSFLIGVTNIFLNVLCCMVAVLLGYGFKKMMG